MANAIDAEVVQLDYEDLINQKDLTSEIEKAFGVDGIGVLTVKNVPNFIHARDTLLPLASQFAKLPDEVKAKYEHEKSYYSFGWSHGKEKLQGGKPDNLKGSYYNNPQFDRPVDDEELIAAYLPFAHPNIWPKEDLPELEIAFKRLGQIIVEVGLLVAKQCDNFIARVQPTYHSGMLEKIVATSKCCKARLLHYFPLSAEDVATTDDGNFSNWCGWHNDHSSLTGLTPAIYLDDSTGEIVSCPDPAAGLYVMSRSSQLIRVRIPPSHIGFQIGETAQIHSGGALQATPHAVRGARVPGITRESFAVFMGPMWDEPMNCPPGVDPAQTQTQTAALNLPPGVPPLASRWNPSQNFGEFSEATHKAYY
jgi:isopenicillin N synthase-like dioxygenase